MIDELRSIPEARSADFERSRHPSNRLVLYTRQYADLDPRSRGPAALNIRPWMAWT
jgi:hypothetical protein